MKVVVTNPDGRPRLLDLIDQTVGLRSVMEPGVIYSLADRPCGVCGRARRDPPGESVALVANPHATGTNGTHLISLCAEHAAEWESRR
jgi:hypothetical protein